MSFSRTSSLSYGWYLITAICACGTVIVGAYLAYDVLFPFFMTRPTLNGIILALFVFGTVLALTLIGGVYLQSRRLEELQIYMAEFKSPPQADRQSIMDQIKGYVRNMGSGIIQDRCLAMLQALDRPVLSVSETASALSDAALTADDTRAELVRYFMGVMIVLGLIGTFWGLLVTVSGVKGVLQALEPEQINYIEHFATKLKSSMGNMLGGMSTAFSTSLFGLGGSAIVGFLDVLVRQARSRLIAALDEFVFAGFLPVIAHDATAAGLAQEQNLVNSLQWIKSELAQTRITIDTGQNTREKLRSLLEQQSGQLERVATKLSHLDSDLLNELRNQTKFLENLLEHAKLTSKAIDHMDGDRTSEIIQQTEKVGDLLSVLIQQQRELSDTLPAQIANVLSDQSLSPTKLSGLSKDSGETE